MAEKRDIGIPRQILKPLTAQESLGQRAARLMAHGLDPVTGEATPSPRVRLIKRPHVRRVTAFEAIGRKRRINESLRGNSPQRHIAELAVENVVSVEDQE